MQMCNGNSYVEKTIMWYWIYSYYISTQNDMVCILSYVCMMLCRQTKPRLALCHTAGPTHVMHRAREQCARLVLWAGVILGKSSSTWRRMGSLAGWTWSRPLLWVLLCSFWFRCVCVMHQSVFHIYEQHENKSIYASESCAFFGFDLNVEKKSVLCLLIT